MIEALRRPYGQLLTAALLGVAVVTGAILALGIGSVQLPPGEVVAVLARRMHLISGEQVTAIQDQIVWQLRLPRIMVSLAIGALLAQCGCVLQTLTRNELADPFLLGISSGAASGAVISLTFGVALPFLPQRFSVAGMAFAGALASLALVLAMATGKSGSLPPTRTILAGVAVAQLASAATSMVIMVFGDSHQTREVMKWNLGSFAGTRLPGLGMILVGAVVFLVVLLWFATALDAFAFGDSAAAALGVNVTATRWGLLVGTSLITALTVALAGPIGFVGLTVPHVVRLVVGPGHRALLPIAALAGGLLMLVADTLARSLAPGREIPVGVVTALIGAPMLVFLLRRQARKS